MNVGCIPKKLMHHAASLRHAQLHEFEAFGIPTDGAAGQVVRWSHMIGNINNYIRSLNFDVWRRVRALPNVEYFKGEAEFPNFETSPKLVNVRRVGTPGEREVEHSLEADEAVVIATGSRPRVPSVWRESVASGRTITSDHLFWREEPLGKHVAVIGGGYIALESASALRALGHDVTVYLEEPLRSMDRQSAHIVLEGLESLGVRTVRQSPKLVQPEHVADADNVLLAVGREPNIPSGMTGPIQQLVDPNIKGFYALGDAVEGHPQLTPVAHYSAKQIVAHILHGTPVTPFPQEKLVSAVFTSPFEYAYVGLSHEEAIAAYGEANVQVFLSRYNTLETSMLSTAEPENPAYNPSGRCLAKLVCEGANQRVVGIHFIGPQASEIIQAFSIAVNLGATKAAFDHLLPIHPTTAEEFAFLDKTLDDNFIKKAGCGGGGSC